MTSLDLLQSLLALVVWGAMFAVIVSGWPGVERRVAFYCWSAHAVSAFLIVAVYRYYYGAGDLIYYFQAGQFLARYVEYDVMNHLPDLFRLLLQQPVELPGTFHGAGSSTGSMVAIGGLVGLVTSSIWAASVAVSSATALGQVALWRGWSQLVPAGRRRTALYSVFLVPSAVFWSSSLLKEAFALMGIGAIVWGLARVKSGGPLPGIIVTLFGFFLVGLFKAYVLFPMVAGAGVYFYWSRAASRGGVRLRPAQLVSGAAVTVIVMIGLGELFPAYSMDSVADSIEQQQLASLTTAGGSDFRTTEPASLERKGPLGLLAESPLTLFTALLRPTIIEVRNPLMFLNSLETTLLLYFMFMAYRRTGGAQLARWIWSSPDIMASVAFVALFGVAVGLATTNLGTLSRYRLPMMPFYFYVVVSAHQLGRSERRLARVSGSSKAVGPLETA